MKKAKTIFEYDYSLNKSDLSEVFSWCLGKVMSHQKYLSDHIIKNSKWAIDFKTGLITFDSLEFPFQFLGSESHIDGSWLWGWNNVNHFSEERIALANELKETGVTMGLKHLTMPKVTDQDKPGHTFAVISCALSQKNIGYYRCPYSNGAAYVALLDVDEKVFEPVDWVTFISVLLQALQAFNGIKHKIFIEGFLIQNGTSYEWEKDSIIAHFAKDVLIEFEKIEEVFCVKNIHTAKE